MPLLSPAEIGERAKKIRLFAMDVDGVLTDGSIIVLNSGEEVKFWNVRDRIGFFMLKRSPVDFTLAWITGRESPQVETRAKELHVHSLYQKSEDKGKALFEVLRRFNLQPAEALFIGDDLVDLPALKMAGLAVCPSDAADEVKAVCHWVTQVPGGRGVFRETVDTVLKAQGLWPAVLRQFENPS